MTEETVPTSEEYRREEIKKLILELLRCDRERKERCLQRRSTSQDRENFYLAMEFYRQRRRSLLCCLNAYGIFATALPDILDLYHIRYPDECGCAGWGGEYLNN